MNSDRDQEELKRLAVSCEQKLFALALYLIGGDRNKAYDVAACALAEVIRKAPSLKPTETLLAAVAGVVETSRGTKVMPSPDEVHVAGVADQEKAVLGVVSRALQALSFDDKALVLLRDQLHLPYAEIAAILKMNERDVRAQTARARTGLREKIEGWAHHAG